MLQVDNEWVSAIIYKREGGEQLFCREESEFLNKFKLEE